VPAIIQRGRILTKGTGGKTGEMEAFLIGAPIRIADKPYVGVAVVRKDVNAQRFYVHEIRAIEMLQAPRSKSGASGKPESVPAAGRGAIDTLLANIFAVKEKKDEGPPGPAPAGGP